jgi:hypothetical protein
VRAPVSETEFALPGLWPTREQLLVLKAALMPAEPARAAFQEWVGLIDLAKEFDQDTFRLLPLMYENLRRHGIEHPLMSRLKGIYRLTWYKNNKLFSDVAPVIEALHRAEIPIMLLKGVMLVLHYYRNIALRPMADIDILIPTAMAMRGIEAMVPLPYERHTPPTVDLLRYRHAMQYCSADKGEFDLHWHVHLERREADADDVYWNHARAIEFQGVACLAPDPTRMLFHTAIHGLRWNPEPPVRWIADAVTILRVAGDEIDWDAIVEQARLFRLGHRLLIALSYLKRHFAAPISDSALAQLERQGISLVERMENTWVIRDPTRLYASPLGHFWIGFADYCRLAEHDNPASFLIGFSHFLRFHLKLQGRREIPGYVLRGLSKRFRQWLRPAPQTAVAGSPADIVN